MPHLRPGRRRSDARTAATTREDGRVVLLIAGLFAILGLLIVGGIDVTAIQLAKTHVLDATDAAAADAADAADEGAIYRGGVGQRLGLTDASVQRTATTSLSRQELPAHVTGWTVTEGTGAADDSTAVVRVGAVVRPPLLGGVLSGIFGDVHVSVQSRARADVG